MCCIWPHIQFVALSILNPIGNVFSPHLFLWKAIQKVNVLIKKKKVKVPPRVSFFVWIAAQGKILTINNLRSTVFVLWSGVVCANLMSLFGLSWVIPARVMDLLVSWFGVLFVIVFCGLFGKSVTNRLLRALSILFWRLSCLCFGLLSGSISYSHCSSTLRSFQTSVTLNNLFLSLVHSLCTGKAS